jgi:hypothetical protein
MTSWNPPDLPPPQSGLYERRASPAGPVLLHHWNGSNWSQPNRKDWVGAFCPQSGLEWRATPPHYRDAQRAIPRGPAPAPLEGATAESRRLIEVTAAFFSRPVP